MINKFYTVNAAKWVDCDSDEYNDRVRQLTGLTVNHIAHFLHIEMLPMESWFQ